MTRPLFGIADSLKKTKKEAQITVNQRKAPTLSIADKMTCPPFGIADGDVSPLKIDHQTLPPYLYHYRMMGPDSGIVD